VWIGGVRATVTGSPTATTLSVIAPALPAGPADVEVINPDGHLAILAGAFVALAAPPPVAAADLAVNGVSPTSGPAVGGTVVEILGTGFQSDSQVFIGGVLATPSGSPTATTVTVLVPALPAGPADVEVVNPDGQLAILSGAFFALAPPALAAYGVSTNIGSAGAVVEILGIGFASDSQVWIGGVRATLTGSPTATTLTVLVPALPAGAADVTVVNPDGQVAVLAGAFFTLPAQPPQVA
jgi:hypothetical protein